VGHGNGSDERSDATYHTAVYGWGVGASWGVSAGGSSNHGQTRVGQHGCGLLYLPWWMGAVSRLLAEGLVRTGAGLGSVMIDSQP